MLVVRSVWCWKSWKVFGPLLFWDESTDIDVVPLRLVLLCTQYYYTGTSGNSTQRLRCEYFPNAVGSSSSCIRHWPSEPKGRHQKKGCYHTWKSLELGSIRPYRDSLLAAYRPTLSSGSDLALCFYLICNLWAQLEHTAAYVLFSSLYL